MKILEQLLIDVLTTLYTQFGTSLIIAILGTFMVMNMSKIDCVEVLWNMIKNSIKNKQTRNIFFLLFFLAMILLRTVLCRSIWTNPLSDVLGGMVLYSMEDGVNAEVVENIILFIPFSFFLARVLDLKIMTKSIGCNAISISIVLSICIEVSQLFFKLGTFQISDILYNSLGGLLGGCAYAVIQKHKNG